MKSLSVKFMAYRFFFLLVLFGLFGMSFTKSALASTSLDTTYGNSGIVTTSYGNDATPSDVAIQPADGKAVVVGSASNGSISGWSIARYNTDGSLDSTFGNNGIVTQYFSGNSRLNAVAIQSDGKIVVGGYSTDCNDGDPDCWTIARYNTDGTLDTSFGTNGGMIQTTTYQNQSLNALAIQPDGKIVAVGDHYDVAIVRYNTDGSIDFSKDIEVPWDYWDTNCGPTFYNNNACTTSVDNTRAVALQSDGKILIGGDYGQSGSNNNNFSFLIRLNTDGSFDTSFGNQGLYHNVINSSDQLNGIAVQPDGNILITGEQSTSQNFTSDNSAYIARLTTSGSLDSTFGNGGIVSPDFGSASNSSDAILVEPKDNKIIIGGVANSGFLLSRFNVDGSIDTTYGTNGIFEPTVGNGGSVNAIALQSDYKLVATGNVSNGTYNDWGTIRTNPVIATIELGVSPSSESLNVSTPTSINIVVSDTGQAFNAASATVAVSSNLTITSINNPTTNACNFNYAQNPTTSDPSFAGAIFNGSSTGCTVYTMTVVPNLAGAGTITFNNAQIKADSDSSEILTDVQNGSYTINDAVPTPTPPGTSLNTIDDSVQGTGSDQWNYVGSWSHCTDTSNPACNPNPYNNSVSWNNTTNDTATITFTGRQIKLYALTDPNDGIAGVSIDGGSETDVDMYAVTRAGDQLVWTSPILADGQHTLEVRVTGNQNSNSGGAYVTIDRADIVSTVPSNLSVTNTVLVTYGPNYTLTGTRDPSITSVNVNGSISNTTYPTSTTWQAIEPVAIGDNNFTIYGTDVNNNQTSSIALTVNRHDLGDINGDRTIDLTDASMFAADYGKTDSSTFTYPLSDMNSDGKVDLTDFSILAKLEQ